MQAIVLAGGQGSRLRPLTNTIPKPLVKVLGKPLIEYTLNVLVPHVDELIVVTGYKGEKIVELLGSEYRGVPITYVNQPERKGTGHAVMLCKEHIRDDFVVMYADEIIDEDAMTNLAHQPAAALAFEREDPENFGVIIHDKEMNLVDLEEKPEKPRSNLVSAAAFKLTPDILKHYPPKEKNGEYYLADMIPEYLKKQKMKVVEAKCWLTVNKPEDINIVEKELRKETLSV